MKVLLNQITELGSERCVCSVTSVVSDSLQPYGPCQASLSTGFSRQNTEVGFHALLQGIILTQGSNPHLLQLMHCRHILYHWVTKKASERCNMEKKVQLKNHAETIARQKQNVSQIILFHERLVYYVFYILFIYNFILPCHLVKYINIISLIQI